MLSNPAMPLCTLIYCEHITLTLRNLFCLISACGYTQTRTHTHTNIQAHISIYQLKWFPESMRKIEEVPLETCQQSTRASETLTYKGLRDLWDFTHYLCLWGMYKRYAGSSSTHPKYHNDACKPQTTAFVFMPHNTTSGNDVTHHILRQSTYLICLIVENYRNMK